MVEPVYNPGNSGPRKPSDKPKRGTAMRAYTRQEAAMSSPSAAPMDEIRIMGVPEAELTPKVRNAMQNMMHEIHELRQTNTGLKRRMAELESLADTDPLLPVFNRRAFMRELKRVLAFSDRHNMAASLIYLDMNNFKAINDQYGHAAGDAALKHVAKIINDNVRETDFVGRLGGDEFGVLLSAADRAGGQAKAMKLERIINTTPVTLADGNRIPLSISYGLRTFTQGKDPEAIIAEADARMLTRKQMGER